MFLGRALPVLPLILYHRCHCRLGPQLPHPSPSPPDLRGCWRRRLQPSPSAGPSSPGPAATFLRFVQAARCAPGTPGPRGRGRGKQPRFQNGARSSNASPPAFSLLPPEWQQRPLRCRRVKARCVARRRGKNCEKLRRMNLKREGPQ